MIVHRKQRRAIKGVFLVRKKSGRSHHPRSQADWHESLAHDILKMGLVNPKDRDESSKGGGAFTMNSLPVVSCYSRHLEESLEGMRARGSSLSTVP